MSRRPMKTGVAVGGQHKPLHPVRAAMDATRDCAFRADAVRHGAGLAGHVDIIEGAISQEEPICVCVAHQAILTDDVTLRRDSVRLGPGRAGDVDGTEGRTPQRRSVLKTGGVLERTNDVADGVATEGLGRHGTGIVDCDEPCRTGHGGGRERTERGLRLGTWTRRSGSRSAPCTVGGCRLVDCPGRIPHDFRRTAVRNFVRAEAGAVAVRHRRARGTADPPAS